MWNCQRVSGSYAKENGSEAKFNYKDQINAIPWEIQVHRLHPHRVISNHCNSGKPALACSCLLLPALAKAKHRARVVNCVSSFRQWAISANLYASDDPKGKLPSFAQGPSGYNPWDVDKAFLQIMPSYGVTVPMWFCPVRLDEFGKANEWFRANYNRDINSVSDLDLYLSHWGGINAGRIFCHCWWVPRSIKGLPANASLFPSPTFGSTLTRTQEGWPTSINDVKISTRPIITDLLTNPNFDTNVANAFGGHPFGNKSIQMQNFQVFGKNSEGINCAYADGHVESHARKTIQWQHYGNFTTFY